MRASRWLAVAWVLAGCSSDEGPPSPQPPTEAELRAMPRVELQEVVARLQGPLERPLVVALWRAEMPDVAAKGFLAELDALARRLEGRADVLVLNVDFPQACRDAALPLVRGKTWAFEARAYQDDLMGLGAQVGWGGGPLPVVALFGSRGKRVARAEGPGAAAAIGAQVGKGATP